MHPERSVRPSRPPPRLTVAKAPSKFKPAIPGAPSSAAASTWLSSPHGHPHALSSARKTLCKKPTSMAPSDVLEIPDSPSAPLPAKRISADFSDFPQGSPSKRFKPSFPLDIDHIPHKTPKGKASTSARRCSADRGEASSEVDSLSLGPGRAKVPADPFKSSRKLPPSFPSPRPFLPSTSTPQKTSGDFSDLHSVLCPLQPYPPSLTSTRNRQMTSGLYSRLTRISAP
jgi:hypothetical protein